MVQSTRRDVIRAVANYMHPWTHTRVAGLLVKVEVPTGTEIFAAAERLVDGLEKEGYIICKSQLPADPS